MLVFVIIFERYVSRFETDIRKSEINTYITSNRFELFYTLYDSVF